ncbi:MAG: FeoA family protein [Acinetobacter sp.]
MLLSELKVKQAAVITKVNQQTVELGQTDPIASRLETLGFIPGTPVKVVAKGVFGGDPLLIQIGFTRFALRKNEAEKIEITLNIEGVAT